MARSAVASGMVLLAPLASILAVESEQVDALALHIDREFQVRSTELILQPGGNLVYLDGRLAVHPRAVLGVGWDSDPRGVGDGPGDVFATLTAGVELRHELSESDRLTLLTQASMKEYASEDISILGGVIDAGWQRRAAQLEAYAHAAARRLDQPLAEEGGSASRWEQELTGGAKVMGSRVDGGVRLWALRTDWLDDTEKFTRDEKDGTTLRAAAQVGVNRDAAYLSRYAVTIEGGHIHRAEEGRFRDAMAWRAAATTEIATGVRSALSFDLGWQQWNFSDDFASDPAFDDEQVGGPVGQIRWRWEFEPRSQFSVLVARTIGEGMESNAAISNEAAARLIWRVADRKGLTFWLRQRWVEDSGHAAGDDDGQRTIQNGDVIYEQRLTEGWFFRLGQGIIMRQEPGGSSTRWQAWGECGFLW